MAIIKLEPGQRIAFSVKAIEHTQGNFGPQYKFTSEGGDLLFLNVEPVEKQFARIGLTVENVVGQTIDIERVEKNGTKYTNIYKTGDRQSGNVGTTPSASSAPVARPATTSKSYSAGPFVAGIDAPHLDHLFGLYDACMDKAIQVSKKLDENGIGSSPESTAAIAATLVIAASKDRRCA